MGRLITESGTSLAIVAANNSEVTYFPFNVRAESLVIDTSIVSLQIATDSLTASNIVGKWAGTPLESFQVNVEGIDIKATGVPPNRYLKTNEQGIVAWVEESKSSLDDVDDLDVNNNLTVKGYISAQGNLSANDIDAQSNILSAGVNLLDIFTSAGGSVSGCGTANKVTKWTNSTTIGDSNISDNGDTVTIASSISSGNLLNITNDGDSKFCVAYDGSTTIQGNLSVHGDMHYIDTNVTVTSALSIINSGTGPALYVEQKGTEPIAHFIDKEGDDIIFDDNGRIGLGLFSPEQKLTVAGGISASKGLSAGRTSFFAGNVGIGTAAPTAKLHVGPNSLVAGYTSSRTTLAVSDITNGAELILRGQSPRIWFDVTSGGMGEMYLDSAQLNILSGKPSSAGSSRLYIKAGGDVGIGTTNPGDKLTVQGNISSSGDLCLVDNGKIRLGSDSDLELYSNDTNTYIDGRKGDLYLRTVNAGDDIFLQSLDDIFLRPNNGSAGVTVKGGGAVELYYNGNNKKLETTNTGINVTGDATINGSVTASGGLSANNLDSAYNILSAGTDLVDIFAPASGGGYIDGSGTANTVAKFSDSNTIADSCIADDGTTVTVSAPLSGDDFIRGEKFCLGANSRIDNPSTNNLGLYANNELGLELVSDTRVCSHHDLTVSGSISACSNLSAGGRFFAPNGSATAPTFSFSDFPGTGLLMADTDTLGIATRGSLRMAVDESGNVGIGEASPPEKLTVDGNIRINGNSREFYFAGDQAQIRASSAATDITFVNSSTELVRFASDGNVGIGVTDPGVALTIQGGISASGGLSAGNLDLVGGSGTTNFLPKFTDPDTLGDSIAYVGSDNINIEGGLSALQGLSADNNIYGGGCVNHFVNNVGINIANPNEKLTVQGAISSSNKGVFDRIGIGTNDPGTCLEIDGGTGVASTGGTLVIRQKGNTFNDGISITSSHANSHRIWKDSSSTLYIGSTVDPDAFAQTLAGNIGIGTTSPEAKLTVQGNISASEGLSAGKTSFFADKVGIGTNGPSKSLDICSGTGDDGIRLCSTGSGGRTVAELQIDSVTNGTADFRLYCATNITTRITTNASNPTYFNAGDVGIGLTTPGEKLTVAGGISASEGLSAGKTSYFAGNVGINVFNPTEKLTVGGNISACGRLCVEDIYTNKIYDCSAPGSYYLDPGSISRINVLCMAGYACMSDIRPNTTLTVKGGISAQNGLSANNLDSAFKILSAGTDLTDIFGPGGSAGNVDGSGTACFLPVWSDTDTIENSIACQSTGLLTVNGSISSKGYCSDVNENTFLGTNALANSQSQTCNTAVGEGALQCNATGHTNVAVGACAIGSGDDGCYNVAVGEGSLCKVTGNDNVAIGRSAMRNNTCGIGNTAVGRLALLSNTAGQNVAIGCAAGCAITTGDENTAVGTEALRNTTTGCDNTAVGRSAMCLNGSGSFNTAVGRVALRNNTCGCYNVAVGYNALVSTTEGCCNTGIGSNALYFNTTGSFNIAVGHQSLCSSLTASNNIGIGTRALFKTTTGTQNVGIGKSSLCVNTEGSCNTAIGYLVMNKNTTGEENTAIGRIALCSNTTGKMNIAIGGRTMVANTTGCCNVGIGVLATRCQTSGCFNVGIGQCALFANLTSNNNVGIGAFALKCLTTGTQNTAIGRNSGCANTEGTQNTSVGANSFVCNTTGSFNANLGYNAGFSNTTGNYNTGIGYNANQDVTEADYNTAVGFYANRNTCTGNCNTALGGYALNTNTTGGNNVAVGMMSLCANECASNNVAVGKFALRNNTTANGNVAVGHSALCANTTATHNTAVGCESLKANTIGCYNVALGNRTLQTAVTASENTAVGASAGFCNTTGCKTTAIGFQSLFKNSEGTVNTAVGANSLVCNTTGLGNTAVGTSSLGCNCTTDYSTAVGYLSLRCSTGARNVGIGVSAGCRNSGSCNTFVGYEAGRFNCEAVRVTALGYQALGSACNCGCNNTAVGALSLRSNTTGIGNQAFGYQTLECNTTGCINTAVGQGALLQNVSGNLNVGIGSSAGSCNCTGHCNTSIGTNAGKGDQSGGCNISIGPLAACKGNGVCQNIAIGTCSLFLNASGSDNLMMGHLAGYATNAHNNIGIGTGALQCNDSGTQNVIIGRCAAYCNTTGGNNVGIGFCTLACVETGCCNIAIGECAGRGVACVDGTIAIGHCALFTGPGSGATIAIGTFALKSLTTGVGNMTMGACSMCTATTACNNIGYGIQSQKNLTTGRYNTSFGYNTLPGNREGCYNTAIGYLAGNGVYNGNLMCNTYVGACAGYSNCDGSSNVAVGCGALFSGVSDDKNVAVGQGSLYTTNGGLDNTAVGTCSLYNNTTGCYNTAVGLCALSNNTTAVWNTAVGYHSGLEITTGAQNTLLGPYAGQKTDSGQQNTYLGFAAGRCNVSSNNVAIGYNAARCQTDGCSALTCAMSGIYIGDSVKGCQGEINSIVIGYGTCSCGSNTVNIGNACTTTTYLNGHICGCCSSQGVFGSLSAINSSCNNYFAGNVGMGTNIPHPNARLTVQRSDDQIRITDGTLGYDIGYDNTYFRLKNSAGDTHFVTNWSTGNVGIGTTTPQKSLEIARASTSGGGVIRLTGTGEASQNDVTGAIEFYNCDTTDNTPGVFGIIRGVAGPSGGEGSLQFLTDMPSEGTDACVVAMHIASNANVGIGTTSPSNRFNVVGSSALQTAVTKITRTHASASNNTYTFEVDSSSHTSNMTLGGAMAVDVNAGRAFTINGFGRVGIGTTAPSCTLTVQGSISSNGSICTTGSIIRNPGTTSSGGLCVRDCSNARPWRIYGTGPGGCQVIETSGTSNPIHFGSELGGAINIKTCDTTRMFISGGGHAIGIGSTNPTSTMMFADNCKLAFGNGSDLQIYHDGTHNYVSAEGGCGSLYIRPGSGNTVQIEDKDGQDMITAAGAGAVNLYYNNSKKLATYSAGASVTGNLSASGNGYFDCVIAGGYFEEKAANDELAEYETGSLVVLGQDGELEISTRRNDRKVFGVTQKGSRQPIVLGAEPVLVTGKIRVGDFISTSDKPGHGQRMGDTFHGAVIAQAMESGEGDSFLIKAMIRKM